MSFEVSGKIEEIYEEQQITEKFKKREFVIEIQDGMYPNHIKFQLTQDRCDLIDSYSKGDEIQVHFNLKGRPYTKAGKTTYFTNIEAWRIEGATSNSVNPSASKATQSTPTAMETTKSSNSNDLSGMTFSEANEDELPF
ncbi:MAG: single-strand DNA-binding protein [Arenicella sp.]|jgi:single-strand DNA-binding protein